MSTMLDPWDDAGILAQRLAHADTMLFILVGAAQWCARCRAIGPQFEALAAQAPPHEIWLHFDLEEHADFLGDYLPDDLPILLAYQGDALLACAAVSDAEHALQAAVQRARQGAFGAALPASGDPGIRARLLAQDWAA